MLAMASILLSLLMGFRCAAFSQNSPPRRVVFPYRKMGLTSQQAAAHLLNRFTFGPTPGQVDKVVSAGLENWFIQQLEGGLSDTGMEYRLSKYDLLNLTDTQMVNTFLRPGELLRAAQEYGIPIKDSADADANLESNQAVRDMMKKKGYVTRAEYERQLEGQKVIRAVYSNNQLREVLTDFWFNHFNVSFTKAECRQYILSYERDAIRPRVTGLFSKLLEEVARHPAMLQYLDNASSVSMDNPAMRTFEKTERGKAFLTKYHPGLNENFAREVMELHTMGVDGGYSQKDVTEVARALTGWTVYPLSPYQSYTRLSRLLIEKEGWDRLSRRGFLRQGDFLYRPDQHDEGAKSILGHHFPAGGGYEEGVQVLELLAHQPSTAAFICRKLAVHFVCDSPSARLVNKMAAVFLQTGGDISRVLLTMVGSDEFWSREALHEKVKSPFELAVSAIRGAGADIRQPFRLYVWCKNMGQRLYFFQAPTGFPDRSSYWINTGSLLSRMNFALAFSAGAIPGVDLDLKALNDNREPESAEAALRIYSGLLLPGRAQEDNIKRLTPLISEWRDRPAEKGVAYADEPALNFIAGIIIGSPEFQRK